MPPDAVKKKLIVVGDGGCGKTSLLNAFCYNKFNKHDYETTVFETYIAHVDVNETKVDAVHDALKLILKLAKILFFIDPI
jgi:Rho family protein